MNKLIFIYLLSVFVLFSCKQGKGDDLNMIDTSIKAVEKIVEKYDNNVQSAIDSKNFNYIKTVSRDAMDTSATILNELKGMSINAENDVLRNAAISYIVALQNVITSEEIYATITGSLSDENAQMMDKKILRSMEQAKIECNKYIEILDSLSEK